MPHLLHLILLLMLLPAAHNRCTGAVPLRTRRHSTRTPGLGAIANASRTLATADIAPAAGCISCFIYK